jgi:hypothetical protein
MVIKTNYQDKNKSIYKCDKCKNKIMYEDVNKITVDRCTYHLCIRCYSILKKWLTNTNNGGKVKQK